MKMIKKMVTKFTSVNKNEISKFNSTSDWWDIGGNYKALHAYNKKRVEFI